MEEVIFEPLKSSFLSTTNISIITVLFAFLIMLFLNKTKSIGTHYRNILSLLTFFAGIMAFGTVFFSYFHGERIGTIKIESDHLETAYGSINYKEIKQVLMKKENKSKSMLAPALGGEYTNSMVIISKENHYYYFSEENYPVQKMIIPIREAWQNANKKGATN